MFAVIRTPLQSNPTAFQCSFECKSYYLHKVKKTNLHAINKKTWSSKTPCYQIQILMLYFSPPQSSHVTFRNFPIWETVFAIGAAICLLPELSSTFPISILFFTLFTKLRKAFPRIATASFLSTVVTTRLNKKLLFQKMG